MFSLSEYHRRNPIATKLMGLILLTSSIITLVAVLLQLYTSFNDDIAEMEKAPESGAYQYPALNHQEPLGL